MVTMAANAQCASAGVLHWLVCIVGQLKAGNAPVDG